jgi:hypothetical protein
LLDFTNQLRREGHSIDEAIRMAGETRFLPVVLTSITEICGLLPIALNPKPAYRAFSDRIDRWLDQFHYIIKDRNTGNV